MVHQLLKPYISWKNASQIPNILSFLGFAFFKLWPIKKIYKENLCIKSKSRKIQNKQNPQTILVMCQSMNHFLWLSNFQFAVMIFPPLNVYCLYWFWEGNYIYTAFLYREKKKVSKKKLSKTNGKINKAQKIQNETKQKL